MKKKAPLLILSVLSLISCNVTLRSSSNSSTVSSFSDASSVESSLESSTNSSSISSSSSSSSSKTSLSETIPESGYEQFFDAENPPVVILDGSDAAWNFITTYQSYSYAQFADAYIPMTVRFLYQDKEYVYEEAGVRMKGNTSRRNFYEDGFFYAPVHFKVNLKATFDSYIYDDPLLQQFRTDWTGKEAERKARKDRNFLDVEKFDIKYVPRNYMMDDSCNVREIYAYKCFEEQGIMGPKACLSLASLRSPSAEFAYSCELIEPIDKQFLKRRYGKNEAKGDLYKCVYNGMGKADFSRSDAIIKEGNNAGARERRGKIGVEDNYIGYVPCYQLKTNDDLGEGSDFSKMANFIQTLWGCVYGGLGKEALAQVLDVDEFLTFSAVSFLLGNFDDQRYNMNNYYVYFRPSDGKAVFLPYDWDWCLGLDAGNDMSQLGPLDDWTLCNSRSNVYDATILQNENVSYSLEDYQQSYLSKVATMKDEVLNTQKYLGFAEFYELTENPETRIVLDYMNVKRSHCA